MPTNTFTSNNVIVGFSPNDFFYYQAQHENLMPKNDNDFDGSCNALKMNDAGWDLSCSQIHFNDNSYNCIAKELCKNKDKVKKISQIQTVHSGSDEKYLDTTSKYTNSFTDTINLSIGIVVLAIFILRNRNA
jgi:hypothetical protein